MCHNWTSLFHAGFLNWIQFLEESGRSHETDSNRETGKENTSLCRTWRKSNQLGMMDTFYKSDQTKGQIHGTNKA